MNYFDHDKNVQTLGTGNKSQGNKGLHSATVGWKEFQQPNGYSTQLARRRFRLKSRCLADRLILLYAGSRFRRAHWAGGRATHSLVQGQWESAEWGHSSLSKSQQGGLDLSSTVSAQLPTLTAELKTQFCCMGDLRSSSKEEKRRQQRSHRNAPLGKNMGCPPLPLPSPSSFPCGSWG